MRVVTLSRLQRRPIDCIGQSSEKIAKTGARASASGKRSSEPDIARSLIGAERFGRALLLSDRVRVRAESFLDGDSFLAGPLPVESRAHDSLTRFARITMNALQAGRFAGREPERDVDRLHPQPLSLGLFVGSQAGGKPPWERGNRPAPTSPASVSEGGDWGRTLNLPVETVNPHDAD